MSYKIISDGSCDLTQEILDEFDIAVVPFYISWDGNKYYKEIEEIGIRDFYQRMVDNPDEFPKTSMPTVDDYKKVFEKYAEEGKDIICITITSKFSGSINSALLAQESIKKKYPKIKCEVVDSRVNTCLQGLLVKECAKMQKAGLSFEQNVKKLMKIRDTGRIFFTVGNLDYLVHGGRIGKLKGLIGNTLRIKPLIVLKEGEIFSEGLAFTRNQSLAKCAANLKKYISQNGTPDDYEICVGYGYDKKEGESFLEKLKLTLNKLDIHLEQIGATIGVHTGPYPIGVGIVRKFDRI